MTHNRSAGFIGRNSHSAFQRILEGYLCYWPLVECHLSSAKRLWTYWWWYRQVHRDGVVCMSWNCIQVGSFLRYGWGREEEKSSGDCFSQRWSLSAQVKQKLATRPLMYPCGNTVLYLCSPRTEGISGLPCGFHWRACTTYACWWLCVARGGSVTGSLPETEGQLFCGCLTGRPRVVRQCFTGGRAYHNTDWYACLGFLVHLMPVYATATLILWSVLYAKCVWSWARKTWPSVSMSKWKKKKKSKGKIVCFRTIVMCCVTSLKKSVGICAQSAEPAPLRALGSLHL